MKMLNKINNMFLMILVFLSVSAVSAFADGEFGEAVSIVNEVSKDGMSILGTLMMWFFAVFVPIGCILGGMILGYKQAKKQAEQNQNNIKICTILAYGIVGFFVFVVITAVISQVIFKDITFLFSVIWNFYKDIINKIGCTALIVSVGEWIVKSVQFYNCN